MIKVGLVGEDPNDTSAIKNLLEKRYKGRVLFKALVKGIKGHQLDSPKIKNALKVEFKDQKCKFIVYIRDLDAFKSQIAKLQAKIKWFKDLDASVKSNGILLLNIQELEALIFGDIATFNKIHGIEYKFKKNPMLVKNPKKTLKGITPKFHESHCPEIFKHLNINEVEKNCGCFKEFITEFDAKLN